MILPNSNWNFNNSSIEKPEAITSLDKIPSSITLSENMKRFSFTPKLTSGGGMKAFATFQPFTYVPVGTTITLTSQVGSITLTASATPSSGEFWTEVNPVTSTTAYLEKVAESIASTINQNLSFRNNYDVTKLNTQAYAVSKQYGSLYDLTATSSNTQVMFTNDGVGTSKFESQSYIDYSAFAELYIGDTPYSDNADKTTFEFIDSYRIDTNTQDVNLNPHVVGDYCEPILPIRNIVQSSQVYLMDKGELADGTQRPQLDVYGNQIRILRPYFILYGDSYRYVTNGQQKQYVMGQTPVSWVQLGALNKLNPYNMTDYVWLPQNVKKFSWLSTQPTKEITYDSHEYLQAIVKKTTNSGDFYLSITLNFYDGTFLKVDKPVKDYSELWGNISFDVSPTFWGVKNLETQNGKLVKDYTVQLFWDANGTLSSTDPKTYVMDRICYEENENIIFLNEFGGWDSLEFNGQIQESKSREITTLERTLPFDSNTTDAIDAEVSINLETVVSSVFSLETGLVSQDIIRHSRILSESSAIFIWDKELQNYRNIIINNISNDYDTTLRGGSISIEFVYSVNNNTIKR